MIRKTITVIPFVMVACLKTWDHVYGNFPSISVWIVFIHICLNLLPIFVFVCWSVSKVRQWSGMNMVIHACFYVYLFFVLYYTVLYIPYWRFMTQPVLPLEEQVFPHYNFIPLKTILETSITPVNIWGNILLLLPLGIFVPLIHPYFARIKPFLLLALLVSSGIESVQFLTALMDGKFAEYPSERSFDVDDIILNVSGAVIGFGLYQLWGRIKSLISRSHRSSPNR
ncbi:VanZ family protein [Caldibacillus thermoamylovorans]